MRRAKAVKPRDRVVFARGTKVRVCSRQYLESSKANVEYATSQQCQEHIRCEVGGAMAKYGGATLTVVSSSSDYHSYSLTDTNNETRAKDLINWTWCECELSPLSEKKTLTSKAVEDVNLKALFKQDAWGQLKTKQAKPKSKPRKVRKT